ncbi:MAG: DUF5652 family protein [Candidatus Paceibacteria bacterium]
MSPLFLNEPGFGIFVLVVTLWTLPWKGYALWIAAKNAHKWWFIALLIFNTLAILEIIYIFAVGRPALKASSAMEPE